MSFNNKKHNLEFRIKYDEKGMLIGWKITAKKDKKKPENPFHILKSIEL